MRTALYTAMIPLLFIGCGKSPDKSTDPVGVSAVQTGALTAVTFNIRYGTAPDGPNRWADRKPFVFDLLAGYEADLIGLQEALDFQIDQIQQALPQYVVVAACRDDGQRVGEACPIFYRRDRFDLLDSGTFWFSDTPDVPGSKHWGNNHTRICTWVHLRDRQAGGNLTVYNLHLDHESQISREKSTAMLAERIIRRSAADSFFIVMGDFNMDMDNPAMGTLQQGEGPRLTDSWRVLHGDQEPVGTWHDFGRRFSKSKIDHILVPEKTEVLEADIDQRQFDGRYPSDHFPVFAKIKLPALE